MAPPWEEWPLAGQILRVLQPNQFQKTQTDFLQQKSGPGTLASQKIPPNALPIRNGDARHVDQPVASSYSWAVEQLNPWVYSVYSPIHNGSY